MSISAVEKEFRAKVCEQVRLMSEGYDRYRVFTPFQFDDGDHLVVVLKREDDHWVLSDEGHTYMHLTYGDLDEKELQRGNRQRVISNALSAFSVSEREGELFLPVRDERYGDALYTFVQALLKVTDVTYLSRERVRSTFMEDLRSFLLSVMPDRRLEFGWHDPQRDPHANYVVDCRINGMPRPVFLYGLPNDDKTRDATIALLQFERWGLPFRSVGVFQDEVEINRRVLARFSDVCEKLFSNLETTKDRIASYLQEAVRG